MNLAYGDKVYGDKVEEVNSQKLLGVYIDKELNFTEHVDVTCKKLGPRSGVLKKTKRYLPPKETKLYYNAMIKPVMMYGCTIWCSCSSENFERVFKLQKRAARVILDVDTRERSAKLCKEYWNLVIRQGEYWNLVIRRTNILESDYSPGI